MYVCKIQVQKSSREVKNVIYVSDEKGKEVLLPTALSLVKNKNSD